MLNERTIATIRELFEAEIDLCQSSIRLFAEDPTEIDYWTDRLNVALAAKDDFEAVFDKK